MTREVRPSTHPHVKERLDSAFGHIDHPHKRGFLRRYAETGKKRQSARDAGIHPDTLYSSAWRDDEEFQEAVEVARRMAGDLLEEEMLRRAIDGVARYQFNSRTGEPLRHPDICDCGHRRDRHVEEHACVDCSCSDFEAAPYVEHEYSDRLLERLAMAHLPERYATSRLNVGSVAMRFDMNQLPDAAVERIAQGEHPLAVLASIIAQGGEDADAVRLALPAEAIQGVSPKAIGGTAPSGEIVQPPPDPPSPGPGNPEPGPARDHLPGEG